MVDIFLRPWPPNYVSAATNPKRRSKFQEKNMSRERALNLDQWKTFPKTISQYQFDYDLFTYLPGNNCHLRLLFEFVRGILPPLTKYNAQYNWVKLNIQNLLTSSYFRWTTVVVTAAHLDLVNPELKHCANSNPDHNKLGFMVMRTFHQK